MLVLLRPLSRVAGQRYMRLPDIEQSRFNYFDDLAIF